MSFSRNPRKRVLGRVATFQLMMASQRGGKMFKPSKKNCKVRIYPDGETEKAYIVNSGTNGLVGKGCRTYNEYIAKSICFVEDEKVYAPIWAIK